MSAAGDPARREALAAFALGLGDDNLILGHRLAEWCGRGPTLEEDIALANLALDCTGQAEQWLTAAADLGGDGRTADELAYRRQEREFTNVMLVEQPNEDYAHTMARQFLYDAYLLPLYEELARGSLPPLKDIAAKGVGEVRYHLRHAAAWVVRMGDGTAESRRRITAALDVLWDYTEELFAADEPVARLAAAGLVPSPDVLRPRWDAAVDRVLREATLGRPGGERHRARGGRRGLHTEHLGHLLAEMQSLHRAYPDVEW